MALPPDHSTYPDAAVGKRGRRVPNAGPNASAENAEANPDDAFRQRNGLSRGGSGEAVRGPVPMGEPSGLERIVADGRGFFLHIDQSGPLSQYLPAKVKGPKLDRR